MPSKRCSTCWRARYCAAPVTTQAYVICSVAVDLRISNVVDAPNYVVSGLLPEAIFDGA